MLEPGTASSRIAAVALLMVAGGSAIATVAVPLHARHHANAARIAGEEDRIARMDAVLARQPSPPLSSGEVAVENRFVDGDSEALRTANVQQALASVLRAAGIKPRSSRSEKRTPVEDLQRVGVDVEAAMQLNQLVSVLADLSSPDQKLVVESMRIKPVAPRDPARRGEIEVRLGVSAFVRPGGATAGAAAREGD